ncbi:MAG TPA: hypothetical protein VHR66_01755 [Gemmataceae bacterium]|jgi:hypothetical protein|nr:hypothetical protein [Gemmataceae bacterium]
MHRYELGDVTIHHHRPSRLTGSLMLFALACFWVAAFAVRSSGAIDRLMSSEVFLCALAIVSWFALIFAYVLQGARSLNLGSQMTVWPQWWTFHPHDIRSIAFAQDPAEDFDETAPAIRFCAIWIQPRNRFPIRLIARVDDGLQLWHWSIRNGINVCNPTDVLDDGTAKRAIANDGRPGPSETAQSPS